jgi:ribonuclease HI
MEIEIYTDGGCSGNPGPGGWAYVALVGDGRKSMSGFEANTTNNKMELTAVIRAIGDIAGTDEWKNADLHVYTDSQYVQKGITVWITGWIRNGWKTASKQPVKNQELWRELKALVEKTRVRWEWVRGHVGNEYNELCDAMVQQEIRKNS